MTDIVCLYTYKFWLSLCKIVRSSVILLLLLFKIYMSEPKLTKETMNIIILIYLIKKGTGGSMS